jgi:hypothetical protein
MADQLTSELILKLIDQVSGPARQAKQSLQGIGAVVTDFKTKFVAAQNCHSDVTGRRLIVAAMAPSRMQMVDGSTVSPVIPRRTASSKPRAGRPARTNRTWPAR